MTFVGRFAVLVMICVGVVLIPVQASQVYSQLQARRVTLGETSYCTHPSIMLEHDGVILYSFLAHNEQGTCMSNLASADWSVLSVACHCSMLAHCDAGMMDCF